MNFLGSLYAKKVGSQQPRHWGFTHPQSHTHTHFHNHYLRSSEMYKTLLFSIDVTVKYNVDCSESKIAILI